MAIEAINLGAAPDDGTGDTARAAGTKINASVTALAKAQICGEITAPANRSYILDLSAPFGYTITGLIIQTAAGTATCAVQIDAVTVTGLSGLAASTTIGGGTATAANTVATGAKVTLVVSGVAGASELSFALRITRT